MAAPVDSSRRETGRSTEPPQRAPLAEPAQLAQRGPSILDPAHRRLTVGILASVLVVAFEGIGVATAFPVIARELDGYGLYALGFSAFLTTSLVGMVVSGEISDRRGPRLPYLLSLLSFALGLLAAGVAPTMAVLVLARTVQGIGAGLLIVAVYVIIARAYPEELRARMFGVLSSAWVLPSIIGPAVAGWLADSVSWRLVFLGVLPFVVPALALVVPRLPALETPPKPTPQPRATVSAPGVPARPRWGRLGAAVAVAVGAGLLQYAGQRPDWFPLLGALGLAAGGAALLAPALPRLLPPGTLRAARGLPTTILMRGLLAGAFFGAEIFVPLMLVQERGLSTTLAGFCLTGAALGWTTGSWYQGRPTLPVPRRVLVRAGGLLVATGIGLVAAVLIPAVPVWVAAVAWTVAGLGMGFGVSTLSVLVLKLSPDADAGANSAALQVSDAVGSIAVMGVTGAVFAAFRAGPGQDTPVFLGLLAATAAVALLGALLAPRLRPAGPAGVTGMVSRGH